MTRRRKIVTLGLDGGEAEAQNDGKSQEDAGDDALHDLDFDNMDQEQRMKQKTSEFSASTLQLATTDSAKGPFLSAHDGHSRGETEGPFRKASIAAAPIRSCLR